MIDWWWLWSQCIQSTLPVKWNGPLSCFGLLLLETAVLGFKSWLLSHILFCGLCAHFFLMADPGVTLHTHPNLCRSSPGGWWWCKFRTRYSGHVSHASRANGHIATKQNQIPYTWGRKGQNMKANVELSCSACWMWLWGAPFTYLLTPGGLKAGIFVMPCLVRSTKASLALAELLMHLNWRLD